MIEINHRELLTRRNPDEARLIDSLSRDKNFLRRFNAEQDSNKLNQMAVSAGLMMPNSPYVEAFQEFINGDGKKLSLLEAKCFWAIHSLTPKGPVNTKCIFSEVYGSDYSSKNDHKDNTLVWVLINRIREKLGKDTIITKYGIGYLSASALESE